MVAKRRGFGFSLAERPDLPDDLKELDADALTANGALDGVFVNAAQAMHEFATLDMRESVIEAVVFTGKPTRSTELNDVIFRNCDFSGVTFPEGSRLNRVRFENCRATGANFSATELTDVEFEEGKLNLASFRMTNLRRVGFRAVNAHEIDFYGATLSSCFLLDSDVTGISIDAAKLDKVAFTRSTIDGLRGVDRLSGAYLTSAQMYGLLGQVAASIGIVIDSKDVEALDIPMRDG